MPTDRPIPPVPDVLDYAALTHTVDALCARVPDMECGVVGHSFLGRAIPYLRLGHGTRPLLYLGTHDTYPRAGRLLLRFACDVGAVLCGGRTAYGISWDYLLATRTLYLIPVWNVDGVELSYHGIPADSPLSIYLARYAPPSGAWVGNARGVELDGAEAAREAEGRALFAFLDDRAIRLFFFFRAGDARLNTVLTGEGGARRVALGNAMSRLCPLSLGGDADALTAGVCARGIPAYGVGIGGEEDSYTHLRRLLFCGAVLND